MIHPHLESKCVWDSDLVHFMSRTCQKVIIYTGIQPGFETISHFCGT